MDLFRALKAVTLGRVAAAGGTAWCDPPDPLRPFLVYSHWGFLMCRNAHGDCALPHTSSNALDCYGGPKLPVHVDGQSKTTRNPHRNEAKRHCADGKIVVM